MQNSDSNLIFSQMLTRGLDSLREFAVSTSVQQGRKFFQVAH